MCGLYGIMGPGIIDIDREVLRDLAMCSVVRGTDGAGMFQGTIYSKRWVFDLEKTGNQLAYLMWYHEHDKHGNRRLFNDRSANFFAGHVRAATKGVINSKNAHPFENDRFVGMHNGTLMEWDYRPSADMTDSEMMFADMAKRGIKPVLAGLHADSAFAVVVFDKETGLFTFARNKHRTLFMTYHKHRKVIYWASEAGMLLWLLRRRNIDFGDVLTFVDGTMYTFDPFDIRSNNVPDWKIELIKPLPEPVKPIVAVGGPLPATFQADEQPTDEESVETSRKTTEKSGVEKNSPLTFRRNPTSRKVFNGDRFYEPCKWCQKELTLVDQHMAKKTQYGEFICEECEDKYEKPFENAKSRIWN